MGIYAVGSWIAVGFTAVNMHQGLELAHRGLLQDSLAYTITSSWPAMLVAVYLPMLWLVLRGPSRPARIVSEHEIEESPV
jgi:hypothetical protein